MSVALGLLRGLVAAGVVVLALRMVASWRVARDAAHGSLALGIVLLSVATVLGRVASAYESTETWLGNVALVAFAASGPALLAVRDALFRLSRRMWLGAVATTAALTTVALLLRVGRDPDSAVAITAGAVVAALWIAMVAEPTVRFWRGAEGRPSVQRFHLRGLSVGYATIAGLAVSSVAFLVVEDVDGVAIAIECMVLLALPALYVVLVAPSWARRWWREPEERAVARAMQELVTAEAPAELSERAVQWAERLVGGHAAVIVDTDGTILAQSGPDDFDLVHLAAHVAAGRVETGPVQLAGPEPRWAIAVPLTGTGTALAVLSDPVAPLFGYDELEALAGYGASVATALERVGLVERVERQSDRYQTLLQAIGDLGVGFLIVERSTDRVVFANQAFAELTGYTRDELLALPTFERLLQPDQVEPIVEAVNSTARGEIISQAYETIGVRSDGARIFVEVAAKVTEDGGYVVALVRDMSERRRLAEMEQRRFEQLSQLAIAAGELAGRSTDVDELLPAAAEAARRILSSEWAEIEVAQPQSGGVGRGGAGERRGATPAVSVPLVRGHETVGVLTIGPRRATSRAAADDEAGFDEVDAAIVASFGAYLAEAIVVAQAFGREGRLVAELRDMHRMKDALLSAVSHEVRGPLTVLLGVAATLERHRQGLPEHEIDQLLATIGRNARKVDRLVGDLLDMDRLQRGLLEPQRQPTDLAELVQQVVSDTGLDLDRVVHLEIPSFVASVDAPKVERIVENLVTNAERHTPPGTEVWIRADQEADGVLLIVEDAGPGVPEHAREAIFEAFRRGDDAYAPGLGIGLSLVARFAELHGGRAWVEDRDGGGASFRVHLPADVSTAESSSDDDAENSETTSGTS